MLRRKAHEEFCWANGVGDDVISEARHCFDERKPVFGPVHERLLSLFHHYLTASCIAVLERACPDYRGLHVNLYDLLLPHADELVRIASGAAGK